MKMILQTRIMKFVTEMYPNGEVTTHAGAGDGVVFKIHSLISLKEFTEAVENEFPCVNIDFPVDKSLIMVWWKRGNENECED